ncbi:MAG: FtsX-like permease family protein, partial [Cellvibrio sp.]|uniref:ABC transporter permease n=1 Tax=Cellvibrio sp. TaxID=1965322 RepID=UPI0031A8C421
LYDAHVADEVVVMRKAGVTIQHPEPTEIPSTYHTRMTTRDFFSMFDVQFIYGGPWSKNADESPEHVVILSEGMNNKFFKGENSLGQAILLDGELFTVVGVVSERWQLVPNVYDLNNLPFEAAPDAYIPFFFAAAKAYQGWGNVQGWANENIRNHQDFLQSEDIWIQAWVSLNSAEKRQEFTQFLENYIATQKEQGRFKRSPAYQLNTPEEWLNINNVVSKDNKQLLMISFVFLMICLVNSTVLMLAKFLRKAPETGIRRALGASRYSIFFQHLTEAFIVGVAGALLGLLLSLGGLAAVRALYSNYENVAVFNSVTVAAAMLLALVATLLSGFLPAWRISHSAPAKYLKTR